MRNASKKLVPASTVSSKRSLGMTMTVSTLPISSESACSACCCRRLPSNKNGLVTTATVSAPSSLAREATTGAAPLPVPPPRPVGEKIMSEPSSASMIFSVSFQSRFAADSRIRARAETLGELGAKLQFDWAPRRKLERLQIGVGRDKLDALRPWRGSCG